MTYLTSDICSIIAKYIIKSEYELLDWIPNEKLSWRWLSANPNAISLLKKNLNETTIDWMILSRNPNAIEILEQNPDLYLFDNLEYAKEDEKWVKEQINMLGSEKSFRQDFDLNFICDEKDYHKLKEQSEILMKNIIKNTNIKDLFGPSSVS